MFISYTQCFVLHIEHSSVRVTWHFFGPRIQLQTVYEYRYEYTVMYDIYEYTVISSLEFLGAIQADNR